MQHPSKRNFRCKVPECKTTPRGCDVPRHYKKCVNWSKVEELKSVVGGEELQEELEKVDGHTRFAYMNKHTEESLPTWQTHAPVPVATVVADGESSGTGGTGPKQTKLSDHFQVKIVVKFCIYNKSGEERLELQCGTPEAGGREGEHQPEGRGGWWGGGVGWRRGGGGGVEG